MKINKRILKSIKTLPLPGDDPEGDGAGRRSRLVAHGNWPPLIRLDQAITANILRICNSAYFGLRPAVDHGERCHHAHGQSKTSCGPSLPRGFRGISRSTKGST